MPAFAMHLPADLPQEKFSFQENDLQLNALFDSDDLQHNALFDSTPPLRNRITREFMTVPSPFLSFTGTE